MRRSVLSCSVPGHVSLKRPRACQSKTLDIASLLKETWMLSKYLQGLWCSFVEHPCASFLPCVIVASLFDDLPLTELCLREALRGSYLSPTHQWEREDDITVVHHSNPVQFTVQFVWEQHRKSLKVLYWADQMDRKWVTNQGTFLKAIYLPETIRERDRIFSQLSLSQFIKIISPLNTEW